MVNESSSHKWRTSLFGKMMIIGVCGILMGAIPMTAAVREDLQQVYDRKITTSGALTGWNLTKIGDINGDGSVDYGMGSPGENKAYVFFGPLANNFNPASTTTGWVISGPSNSDFGWDIQGIGNYDGDQYDDLIVGAPGVDKAYIWKGRSSGVSTSYTSANLQINGTDGEMFGHSVCGLNYDGDEGWFAAVGAPMNIHFLEDVGDYQSGAVFMFNLTAFSTFPSKYMESSNANFTYTGDVYSGRFGHIVRNVGDLNYDSIDDLGMGDPFYSPSGYTDKGAFYFQFGKNVLAEPPQKSTSDLDGIISGRNQSKFGWSAKGLEDVGGSFEDDIMIGAPYEGEGKAFLFFGVNGSFPSKDLAGTDTPDNEFNGTNPGDLFGWSFDRTMIAGTTFALSISAPGYDNGTKVDAGAIYSFWSWSGQESADNAKSAFIGETADEMLGYSLCEVNYTLSNTGPVRVIGILASSPFYGSTNGGRIQIFKRNQLPELSPVNINFKHGNPSTIFTITVEYSDPDNDAPAYVKVDFFYDQSGDNLAKTVTLNRVFSDTDPFSVGVTYESMTTLPNSIRRDSPNANLYLIGYTRAVRGSISMVFSGVIVPGPEVDGIIPSAADNLNVIGWDTLPEEDLIEGSFKISWEWPEDDDGTLSSEYSRKVSKLEIRYFQGNVTMTNSNWDNAVSYITFSSSTELKNPFANQQLLIGAEDETIKPFLYYSVAMRAYDEEDNEGNVSATLTTQAYWRRPEIPGPCESVDIFDYKGPDNMGDDGGKLLVQFTPPNLAVPMDISYYEVFVTEAEGFDLDNLSDYNKIDWEPDMIITKVNEEAFYNTTFILDSYHGGDLLDGGYYYVAIVPVNWLDQHSRIVTWSDPEIEVKIINDNLSAIARIKGVSGTSINGEAKIRVTWTPTTDTKFTRYEIYGQSFSYTNIDDAVKLATITERGLTEFIVGDISGTPISQAHLYFFTVLVMDHNDHIDTAIDDDNTVRSVKYINPDSNIAEQIKGVSMMDVPNDGGGVLTLSWFRTFAQNFWQYNVYFSDEPIMDISTLDPISMITNKQKTDLLIEEYDGDPLVDGTDYYAAVTIVDWDLEENLFVDDNNSASAQSINQSDFEAPGTYPGNVKQSGDLTNTEFTVSWDPISIDQIPDFSHYLVTVSGPKGTDKFIVEGGIGTSSLLVDRLTRGTKYYVNVSIVDDNGNFGPGSPSIEITTAGADQPPMVVKITVTIGEDLYNLNNTEEVDVDLNDYSVIYFTGEGSDDYTVSSRLLYSWNLTLPSGESVEKTSYAFDLDLSETGTYSIKLVVTDQAGMESEDFIITIKAEKPGETTTTPIFLIIIIVIVAIILAIVVVLFVLFSGSRSQRSQKLEEYKDRRQNIESMEPIYANLPTWTCDCGTTSVTLIENAYCNSCYQSHEAVPIDGIDTYLMEHDLVLAEMKIVVTPGWQGQDVAKTDAAMDLDRRKKRAMDALNEEYAPWLQGTEYEKELENLPKEGMEEPEGPKVDKLHHDGAIIPGQMPPSGPIQPQVGGPIQPQVGGGPIRPMVGGQPGPVRPPMVQQQGAPGPRPPMPQVGLNQQKPPQNP